MNICLKLTLSENSTILLVDATLTRWGTVSDENLPYDLAFMHAYKHLDSWKIDS